MSRKKGKCSNPSAGDGTAYWYEWYVGLKYVIDLISPNTSIKSIIFQSLDSQKLDDVVILYKDGTQKCIQVKNTREDNKIGFQTFINNKDYLRAYADEWKTLSKSGSKNVKIQFVSNKESSGVYNGRGSIGIYKRPPLDIFWKYVRGKTLCEKVTSLSDISLDGFDDYLKQEKINENNKEETKEKNENNDWTKAWEKFLDALDVLNVDNNDLRLKFINSFDLLLGENSLFELKEEIILLIKNKYNLDYNQSKRVFEDLSIELPNWTTKEGKSKNKDHVTQQDVINVLFDRANNPLSDHHIPITTGFFESRRTFVKELISTINSTTKKVIFLSGKPNVGKTTIVSYLYNGYKNVIDFRFYSFRPITVDSKFIGADKGNSSHRGLWGDLFVQVFDFIRNAYVDYSEFNIIPYIDWMDDVKLQGEVLRLLSEIASRSEKKIVVAIDGIDHAARSKDDDNYLKTMCAPSNIPDNVCFIIAGQPVDGYVKEYPLWLMDKDIVEYCYVPDIDESDINELYDSYELDETLYPKSVTVKYINKISNGNTLTAVLSFKEAEKCINISELEKRLEKRNLSDEVVQYYEEVWNHCFESFISNDNRSIELKIACIFSYSISIVTSNMLADIFDDMSLCQDDWKSKMRKLFPLVSERYGGFIIDINDVRIFLKKKINSCYDKKSIEAVKLALVKYYFKSDDCIRERHFVAYDLLKGTEHDYFLAENCNSKFVIEAFSLNQPIVDIRKYIEFSIQLVICMKRWDTVRDIFCAIRTLGQFNKTLRWEDRVYYENKCSKYLFKSEILSINITYDYNILNEIVKDATELFEFCSQSRAKDVLNLHFGSKDISWLSSIFGNKDEKSNISSQKRDLIRRFGSIARYCEFELSIEKDISDLVEKDLSFLDNYIKGWFEASLDFERVDINKTVLDNMIFPTDEILLNYLVALSKKNYWENMFEITKQLDILSLDYTLVLQIASWYVQKNRFADTEKFKDIIVTGGVDLLSNVNWKRDYPNSFKLKAYCNLLFVHGFFGICNEDFDSIVYMIYPSAMENNHAEIKYFLAVYYNLGKYYNKYNKYTNIDKIYEGILSKVFNLKKKHISYIIIDDIIHDLIIKLINLSEADVSSNLGEITFKLVSSKLEHLFSTDTWDHLYSPIIIAFLSNRGESRWVIEYVNKVCGPNSNIWKTSINERDGVIESIFALSKNVNIESSFLTYLMEWNKWFSIGYSGHKEYILFDLVEWLEVLLIRKPSLWKKYIYQVLEISEVVHRLADNRVGLSFEYIFAKAAFKESKSALACMLNATKITFHNKMYVLAHLTKSMLKSDYITLDEAVILWNYLVTHLKNSDLDDTQELGELKEEINQFLHRHGYSNNELRMFNDISKSYNSYASLYPRGNMNCESKTFNVKSIDELETEFSEGQQNWEECLLYVNHLKVKRPQNMKDYLERIIILLEKRKATYEWKGDGIYDVYRALFPLIDDNVIWRIFSNSIIRLEDQHNSERWAELVADRIMSISILNTQYSKVKDIELFVERIIDMHLRFVSGNYRFNYVSNATAQFSDDVITWDDVFKTLM